MSEELYSTAQEESINDLIKRASERLKQKSAETHSPSEEVQRRAENVRIVIHLLNNALDILGGDETTSTW